MLAAVPGALQEVGEGVGDDCPSEGQHLEAEGHLSHPAGGQVGWKASGWVLRGQNSDLLWEGHA